MTRIDNERFGEFILNLRKEKGLTQKELAEKLYISDKAVSKWERGLSMPDIELLIPLSKIFDVTTTELLSGKRIEKDGSLTVAQVEELMNKTIYISKEEADDFKASKKRRRTIFILSFTIFLIEVLLINHFELGMADDRIILFTGEVLILIFGIYLSFFAKERLPSYYDENKIRFFSDGIFRINMVGLHFNNSNWGHILRVMHLSLMMTLIILPALYMGLVFLLPSLDLQVKLFLNLIPLFSIFIPTYIVGKKYE